MKTIALVFIVRAVAAGVSFHFYSESRRADIAEALIELRASVSGEDPSASRIQDAAKALIAVTEAGWVPSDVARLLPPPEILEKVAKEIRREDFADDESFRRRAEMQPFVAQSWAPELATRIDAALPLLR